jgi:chemotaxis protein CheC
MNEVDVALDDLELDALTEIVNIGVSRAAASLRKMVGRQVLLSVPAVEVVTQKAAAALIGQQEREELIAVRQDFDGAFSGKALLIFPESRSLELVRAVAGEDISADEIAEMEHEALSETGNIILNSCLGTMANMLQESVHMSLPEVLRGDGVRLFGGSDEPVSDVLVLFLYINFSVRERDVRGYIAMILDLPSLAALKVLVGDFIRRVVAEPV